jgi:hypothetical protein
LALDDEKKESPVLLVMPGGGGLWQVKLEDGDLLLGLSSKDVARRFAQNWSLLHGPCEIHVYRRDGEIEQVIAPSEPGDQLDH